MLCIRPYLIRPQELLAPLTDENLITYSVRQPTTAIEIEHACRAADICGVSSIRYAASDAAILARLGNDPQYCDHPRRSYRSGRFW